MATAQKFLSSVVPSQVVNPIPRSFLEALKQGWRIVAEKSKPLGAHRCGTATLEHDGRRISVYYFADSDGYHFGSIKPLE